jgi:hypothetical protein
VVEEANTPVKTGGGRDRKDQAGGGAVLALPQPGVESEELQLTAAQAVGANFGPGGGRPQ